MNRFKRAISLAIVFIFAGISFAGCALFERDINYYNNLEVARIGDDIVINKKQLMDGYSSFGYQYVSNFDYTLSQAYDQTLEILINREVGAKLSANMFGFGEDSASFTRDANGNPSWGNVEYLDTTENKMKIAVTEAEARSARKTSFDAMESALREIEKEVRKDMNWDSSGEEELVQEESKQDVYTPYEKYLIKQGNTYKINLEKYRETTPAEIVYENNDDFLEYLTTPRGDSAIEKSIATKSMDRLVLRLKNNEKGLNHKDNSDSAILKRELVRIQSEQEKTLLVQRLEECYEQGIYDEADYNVMMEFREGTRYEVTVYNESEDKEYTYTSYEEYVNSKNRAFVGELVRGAETEYKYKVRNAINRYNLGLDAVSGYASTLLNSLDGVYFVPKSVANQFFTVSHILIGYTDEQKTKLAEIEAAYNQDKNVENYNNEVTKLKASVTTKKRVDGVETGEAMTAAQVLADVERIVMPNAKTKTPAQKAASFHEAIYMYNSDPGMVNPEFEYIIGADMREDKSANSTETDSMSGMVPEFTAAARELFNYNYDEGRGGVRKEQNGNEFEYIDLRGTMSGLVWTEHGAHIIMYTRNISEFIYTNTADLLDDTFETYLHATRTSYGNKTTFDAIVESITKPTYSQYEQQILAVYKGENKTTYSRYNYKDLTK